MIGHILSSIRLRRRRLSGKDAGRRSQKAESEVIKGTAGNAVIVKSPNTEYFKEAIFILCDDVRARPGKKGSDIIAEARRAAADYCRPLAPPKRKAGLEGLLVFTAGAALGFALGYFLALL